MTHTDYPLREIQTHPLVMWRRLLRRNVQTRVDLLLLQTLTQQSNLLFHPRNRNSLLGNRRVQGVNSLLMPGEPTLKLINPLLEPFQFHTTSVTLLR